MRAHLRWHWPLYAWFAAMLLLFSIAGYGRRGVAARCATADAVAVRTTSGWVCITNAVLVAE